MDSGLTVTSKHQWRRLAIRWLLTTICCASIFGTLLHYERKGVTTSTTKRWFNVWANAAILGLSLNFPEACKDIFVICNDVYNVTAETILGVPSEEFKKLLQSWVECGKHMLKFHTKLTFYRAVFLIAYVLIFGIGANIGIILLGMAYSYDPGNVIRLHSNHVVNMTSMDGFWPINSVFRKGNIYEAVHDTDYDGTAPVSSRDEQWNIAHTYGQIGIGIATMDPNDTSLNNVKPAVEQTPNGLPNWKYHFREYNLQPSHQHLSFRTDRYVEIKPQCTSLPIMKEGDTLFVNTSQDITWLEFRPTRGTELWAYSQPENDLYPCGPRCVRLYAGSFHDHDTGTEKHDWVLFNCTVIVSQVYNRNTVNDLHEFPDEIARILGASIALNAGHSRSSANHSMMHFSTSVAWGNLTGHDNVETANVLGRWVAGAIAVMDTLNTKKIGSGDALSVGVKLTVNWERMWMILGTLLGTQSFLTLVAAAFLSFGCHGAKTSSINAAGEGGGAPTNEKQQVHVSTLKPFI
ncbi:hypothetical protein BZA77DRAFT_376825 [Pyronema omphalodes]|nr:hypothetical protein BZA77DRAFT_376825 [Pyronema omphalodes]